MLELPGELPDFLKSFEEHAQKMVELRTAVNARAEELLEAPMMIPASEHFHWDINGLRFECKRCHRHDRKDWKLIDHHETCSTGRLMSLVWPASKG